MRTGRKLAVAVCVLVAIGSMRGEAAELSLQEAVNRALSENTALKITQMGERNAEATYEAAKGARGVTVSASDNLRWANERQSASSSSNSVGLDATLPLYTGGKNEANVDRGLLGMQSAVLTTERAKENLKLSVVQAYYTALEAQKTIAVRQQSVDNYQQHLDNTTVLYEAGDTARVDVLRASVALSEARQQLIAAEYSYDVELSRLRNYVNINRDEPITLTDDFVYEEFATSMGNCLRYAMRARKDLMVLKNTLAQRELDVKIAKADYLPTVNLSVGGSHSNTFRPSSANDQGLSAGVSASWKLFDSGVTAAKVDAAEADLETARLELDKSREDIDLSMREAYLNMRQAQKRFVSTGDAVREAVEDYRIASEKYRIGEGIFLDVIDAQVALSTAQLNYISSQYDYARYKAQVENVMGLGLNDWEAKAAKMLDTGDDAHPLKGVEDFDDVDIAVADDAAR